MKRPTCSLETELESTALLYAVDMDEVAPLLENCPVRTLAPREVLIRAGEPNEHLYLLLSGRLSVRLSENDPAPIATVEGGESVGEISLIDKQPASAFVVAETESRVLVIEEERLWTLVRTSHALSSNLLNILARRLRSGNAVIHQDRERLQEYRFHATVDALTGLFNRYWLNIMLPRQMERSAASGEPLALLMIDIDHFKQYNDGYGHVAGDHAICAVASALQMHLRPGDMAARYGGEEFVVILPNSDLDGAQVVAERLRTAVAATPINLPSSPDLPSVTISLGAARMDENQSAQAFVEATDKALYRAKRAGRNRVEL